MAHSSVPRVLDLRQIMILRLTVRLDDYLWFASYELGMEIDTAPILHSYALSFALSGRERIIAVGGIPNYDEDLREIDIYCTPAKFLLERDMGSPRRTVLTYNSIENPTLLTVSKRFGDKANDPKFGRRQVLMPGLRFDLVAFVRSEGLIPRVFRLGKKRSPVVIEKVERIAGAVTFDDRPKIPFHAVNPLDVTGEVLSCIPRAVPPHMVYEAAEIRNDFFIKVASEFVHVPMRVRQWVSN